MKQMNKIALATLIAACFASNATFAETNKDGAVGTITINGEVVDTTCTVEGTSGADVTVQLPKVSKTLLVKNGDTAGDTTFTIKLKNCTGSTSQAKAFFYNDESNVSANGRLINKASGSKAGNVTIELANLATSGSVSPINVTKDVNGQGVTPDVISGNTATLSYIARYYAEGQSTAGKVQGVVRYVIDYK